MQALCQYDLDLHCIKYEILVNVLRNAYYGQIIILLFALENFTFRTTEPRDDTLLLSDLWNLAFSHQNLLVLEELIKFDLSLSHPVTAKMISKANFMQQMGSNS